MYYIQALQLFCLEDVCSQTEPNPDVCKDASVTLYSLKRNK